MILFLKNLRCSLRKYLLFLMIDLCIVNFFCRCSKDTEVAGKIEEATELIFNTDSEMLFHKGLDFISEGGEKIISFTTNKDWTFELSQSGGDVNWCSVFPAKGTAGENTVMVKVLENESYDDRNVVLTLGVKELSKKLVVTQKQKDAISLTTAKYELDENGGRIQVEVMANVDYKVIIPEQYKGWIHENNSTRGLLLSYLTFTIDKSEEYDKREGEIIIQNGELTEVLKIYQKGKGVLLLSQNEYIVSDRGGEISVELSSNFEYEVKMPQVDWVIATTARSMSSHTLYYTITPNENYDSRETEIVYYDRNNKTLADTLKVVQVQKDAIILSKKEYSVDSSEIYIEVLVNSNVNFDVGISDESVSWINKLENTVARGLNEYKVPIRILANNTYDERVGKITFSNEDSGLSEMIIIMQSKKNAMILSEREYLVDSDGSDITVEVSANIDFDINILNSWITKAENPVTKGLSVQKVYFEISANTSLEERVGKIVFSAKDYNIADTIIVIQAQRDEILYSTDNGNTWSETFPAQIGKYLSIKTGGEAKLHKSVLLSLIKTATNKYVLDLSGAVYEATEFPAIFAGNQYLTSIEFPKNIQSIAASAFDQCSNLSGSIVVPVSVSKIGEYAFSNTNIEKIILSENMSVIEKGTFSGCILLTSVEKMLSIKVINHYAFNSCYELRSIDLSSVEWLGDYCFNECRSLISILFARIEQIGNKAFYNCISLEKVLGLSQLRTIYPYAFEKCKSLREIDKFENLIYLLEGAFKECISLQKISIPSGVEKIAPSTGGYGAFYGCSGLTEIDMSAANSLVDISRAFKKCTSLGYIQIPSSVKKMSDAFSGCSGLLEVDLSAANNLIDVTSAFSDCTSLNSILIPSSVTDLSYTFTDCTSLKEIRIPSSVTKLEYTFRGCSSLENIEIPSSVTSIYGAFTGCRLLKKITIPSSVTNMEYAFDRCTALEKVEIPSSVTSIYASFRYCTSLEEIKIPSSVTEMRDSFSGCSSLVNVNIPMYATSIIESFRNCTSLKEIEIPSSVIGMTWAFMGCTSLEKVTLQAGIKSINGGLCFADCTSLKYVHIPESVTKIAGSAFSGCSALSKISIPKAVNEIEDLVFYGCSSLQEIIFMPIPNANSNFSNNMFENRYSPFQYDRCTLYIPKGSKSAFKVEPFNKFTKIVELSE